MAKTKLQKQEALRNIQRGFENSKLVVLTSYTKMPVSDVSDLRRRLNKENVSLATIKKTLLKKAMTDIVDENDLVEAGNLSLAYGKDETTAAKVLSAFVKDHENLKILGGWLENQFLTKEKVSALAMLLSKEETLAKLCGTLNGPLNAFARVLSGNTRGLVNVLSAIKDQKSN